MPPSSLRKAMMFQQTVRAEQTVKMLKEHHESTERLIRLQMEEKERQEDQARHRQQAFELRQVVEELENEKDVYRLLLSFWEAEDAFNSFDISSLDSLEDKAFHGDTMKRFQGLMRRITDTIGQDELCEIKLAVSKIEEFECALSAIGRMDSHLGDSLNATDGDFMEWGAAIDSLESICDDLESVRPKLKKDAIDALSALQSVQLAVTEIVKPRRNDYFALKSMVLTVKSDGEIEDDERCFLYMIARSYRFQPSLIEEMLDSDITLSKGDFYGGAEDAKRIVNDLCLSAKSDGKLKDQEYSVIKKIAASIGVDKDYVKQRLLEKGGLDKTFLPFNRKRFAESVKTGASRWNNLKPIAQMAEPDLRLLHGVAAAIKGQQPLLFCWNKRLFSAPSMTVVTDTMVLIVKPSKDKKSAECEAFGIAGILEVRKLKDKGQEVVHLKSGSVLDLRSFELPPIKEIVENLKQI